MTFIKKIYFLAIIFILLSTPILYPLTSQAANSIKEVQIPDSLIPGIGHLLNLVTPDKNVTFDPKLVKDIMEFVIVPKENNLLYTDKSIGDSSAYYEIDINKTLSDILKMGYSPDIPSYILSPSSIRLSYWVGIDGENIKPVHYETFLPKLETPIVKKGIEYVHNTPDIHTGAYYAYNSYRTIILYKYKGQNVFISLSKQKDISDVGKKGVVLGSDTHWDYLYSDVTGLSTTGLGWVKSYMYDSYSITIFYETNPDKHLVKCAIFKWLNAGWSKLNVVKNQHIHNGLVRYAKTFKTIIESDDLPDYEKMALAFSKINNLTKKDLRIKANFHLTDLKDRYKNNTEFNQGWITDLFKENKYLNRLNKIELQSLVSLEYLKYVLGDNKTTETFFDFHAKSNKGLDNNRIIAFQH